MWRSPQFQEATSASYLAVHNELRQATGRLLVYSISAICFAWFLILVIIMPFSWTFWMVMLTALLSCAGSYLVLERSINASHWILIAGLLSTVGMAVYLFPIPEIVLLSAFFPLISAITVGWRGAVLTEAAAIGLFVIIPPAAGFSSYPPLYLPILVTGGMLGGLLGWASTHSLFTLAHWFTFNYEQAQKNMEEARQHRAQMVLALKDLDLAYYRLERANAALAAAWGAADEAERFKTEFVTNVSHELRTPLNLIVGFSEMMLTSPESYDGTSLPLPYRSDLNSIYQSAQHLLALVDDILDLSRIEVGKIILNRDDVDLGSLITETASMVSDYIHTKGLELRIEVSPGIPLLWVDPLRIRQVLLNLLVNAARFTERGWIRISAIREGDDVRVTVTDTGQGIPPQDLPKVFEAFRTTEQPVSTWHSGTGLGLPISKKFVELHRGRMGVESTTGVGTTFYFTLPCVQVRTPRISRVETSPSPEVTLKADRILIVVSDDPHRAGLIHRYLPEYRLARVTSLEEAIALAMESRAEAILTDEAASPQTGSTVPILRCPLPNSRREVIALGAADLLVKPVSSADLIAAVDRMQKPFQRVLIADEDPDLARLFRRILRARFEDSQMLEAYHGEEVERIMEAASPDLLILSDQLPGTERGKYLRTDEKAPAVIVVSSTFPIRSPDSANEPMEIYNPGGFITSEVFQIVQGILHVLAPERLLPRSREPEPQVEPAA
jgi:signal transduction histidine kinase/DNA-binding response OmpR family regulator